MTLRLLGSSHVTICGAGGGRGSFPCRGKIYSKDPQAGTDFAQQTKTKQLERSEQGRMV